MLTWVERFELRRKMHLIRSPSQIRGPEPLNPGPWTVWASELTTEINPIQQPSEPNQLRNPILHIGSLSAHAEPSHSGHTLRPSTWWPWQLSDDCLLETYWHFVAGNKPCAVSLHMYVHICTLIRTCTHTCNACMHIHMHACRQAGTEAYIQYMHACIHRSIYTMHAFIEAYTQCMHTYNRTSIHTRRCTVAHAYIHTFTKQSRCASPCIHTCMLKYIHTHTYIHTW
jgi:hypothetical protein